MKGSDMPSAVGLVFCVSTIFSKANEDSGELAQNLDVLTFLERSMFIPVQTEEEIAIGKVRVLFGNDLDNKTFHKERLIFCILQTPTSVRESENTETEKAAIESRKGNIETEAAKYPSTLKASDAPSVERHEKIPELFVANKKRAKAKKQKIVSPLKTTLKPAKVFFLLFKNHGFEIVFS